MQTHAYLLIILSFCSMGCDQVLVSWISKLKQKGSLQFLCICLLYLSMSTILSRWHTYSWEQLVIELHNIATAFFIWFSKEHQLFALCFKMLYNTVVPEPLRFPFFTFINAVCSFVFCQANYIVFKNMTVHENYAKLFFLSQKGW